MRICEYIWGAGRTTFGVGSSAGKGNAAWSFQQRLMTKAILKVRSSCEGWTEVREHRSTCVAGRVSEVQLDQQLESLQVIPVQAFDSGEDLWMCSRSWEDGSRSLQHCWQLQHSLDISMEAPNCGNPEDGIKSAGWTEILVHGSTMYITGRVSKVQLGQWLDSLQVRSGQAFDSGENLRMHSRSREDDSRSCQLSWQIQCSLVISTNTSDSGNPEGAS